MFMFYQAREVVFILPAYWGGGWTVWGTNPEGLSSSWADAGNFLLFSFIFSHISLSRMNFLAFRFHWYAGHCENQIQLGALSLSWTNAGPDLFIIWTFNREHDYVKKSLFLEQVHFQNIFCSLLHSTSNFCVHRTIFSDL